MANEMPPAAERHEAATVAPEVVDYAETTCCVVGAGPAGAILALLLARQGVSVTLLEAHGDFDRDFRGDTLHPAILEILDEIGLADKLLALPHSKLRGAFLPLTGAAVQVLDFGRLKTRFPYIAMMPQVRFLEFLIAEARRYPSFRLVLAASVQDLIEKDDVVGGVRYRGRDGWHELRAALVVGADGRFSTVRRLAGLPPAIKASPPMDVLWFRLPRVPEDPAGALASVGRGHVVILLDRGDQWQLGYVIAKGSYQEIHAAGLEQLRQNVAELVPRLADRVSALDDWRQVSLLSVEADRLPRWYRPGLLLIGDAAHVMSPIGGNGINYAIQDAVAAANLLAGPLKAGTLSVEDLAAVQRRREWPTRITQAIVTQIQNQVLARVLRSPTPFQSPAILGLLPRIPFLRDLPARWIAFGTRREHVGR